MQSSTRIYSQSSRSLVKLGLGQSISDPHWGNSSQAGAGCRQEAAPSSQSRIQLHEHPLVATTPARAPCPCSPLGTTAARAQHCSQSPALQGLGAPAWQLPQLRCSPRAKMRWEHSDTECGDTDEFRGAMGAWTGFCRGCGQGCADLFQTPAPVTLGLKAGSNCTGKRLKLSKSSQYDPDHD